VGAALKAERSFFLLTIRALVLTDGALPLAILGAWLFRFAVGRIAAFAADGEATSMAFVAADDVCFTFV